jgi:hypothetical protein
MVDRNRQSWWQHDYERRSCVLVKREIPTNRPILALQLAFPDTYPNGGMPTITALTSKLSVAERKRVIMVCVSV